MKDPEPIMDTAVTSMGGVRLIPPANRPGKYADYVFRADNVVAELKSLQNHELTEAWWDDLFLSKYDEWRSQGRVPLFSRDGIVRTNELPEECERELGDILRKKLKGVLAGANRQILSTQKDEKMLDSCGLLIISVDGSQLLGPEYIAYILNRSLRVDYSGIRHVVLISANLELSIASQGDQSVPFFVSVNLKGRLGPNKQFLSRLGSEWFKSFGVATGRDFGDFTLTPDASDLVRGKRLIEP